MIRSLAACLVLGCISVNLWAHDLGVAQVILEDRGDGAYTLRAKLSTRVDPVAPLLPGQCQLLGSDRDVLNRTTQQLSWQFSCNAVEGSDPVLVLPWQREGAMVSYRAGGRENGFAYVDARNGDVFLALASTSGRASMPGVFAEYLGFGIEHILVGLDHLAFVLALCLLASGWNLVRLVTAFTVGHSLTLCLGVLEWVRVPMAPVEVCIALSIAFVARAAMKGGSSGHGFGLVLAFGLLHGLGFASALAEIELPPGQLLTGLFAFNLGVELGQLTFIAMVMLLAMTWRLAISATPFTRPAIAFAIGSMGMFWVAERLFESFLGTGWSA